MVSPSSKKGERNISQEDVERRELLQNTKGKRTPVDSQVRAYLHLSEGSLLLLLLLLLSLLLSLLEEDEVRVNISSHRYSE